MSRTMFQAILGAALAFGGTGAAPRDVPRTYALDGAPTPAESATVRAVLGRYFGREWSDFETSAGRQVTFTVGHADLDGDGRADLLIHLNDDKFGYCSSHGCQGLAIMATKEGYAQKPLNLAFFYETLTVLPAIQNGMHDLRYDDSLHVFHWNGTEYR